MKKIFCGDCKYYDYWSGDYSSGEGCKFKKIKLSYIDHIGIQDRSTWEHPGIKNKKNNCKDYKLSLFKKHANLFFTLGLFIIILFFLLGGIAIYIFSRT